MLHACILQNKCHMVHTCVCKSSHHDTQLLWSACYQCSEVTRLLRDALELLPYNTALKIHMRAGGRCPSVASGCMQPRGSPETVPPVTFLLHCEHASLLGSRDFQSQVLGAPCGGSGHKAIQRLSVTAAARLPCHVVHPLLQVLV